jgi:hypothetical protein
MTVERGVVRGSNKPTVRGDDRENGFLSLAGGPSAARPSNESGPRGDRRNGSFPLAEMGSPVSPPNSRRFSVGEGLTPQPASQIEPGKGSVPVNPFLPGGGVARSLPVSDMPPKR